MSWISPKEQQRKKLLLAELCDLEPVARDQYIDSSPCIRRSSVLEYIFDLAEIRVRNLVDE